MSDRLDINVPDEVAAEFNEDLESYAQEYQDALSERFEPETGDVRKGTSPFMVVFGLSKDVARDERGRWTSGDGVPSLSHLFSDNLGIQREDMPQIPNRVKGEFLDELRNDGVSVTRESVDARKLKPTQQNYNSAELEIVRDAWNSGAFRDNPIIISRDSRVLDGHHRWAVLAQNGEKIDTYRVDRPINELLQRAHDFADSHGIEARKFLAKYNEDVPRDDHGRWTSEDARRPGETDKQYAKRVVDNRERPAELPEDHEKYFIMDGDTKVVPMDELISSKTAEENQQGAENGAKRMAAAANGEIERRGPITVTPTGDGRYLILDGNGTYSSVKPYGWQALPVHVVTGEAAKLAKEHYQDQPRDDRGRWTSDGLHSGGEDYVYHGTDKRNLQSIREDGLKPNEHGNPLNFHEDVDSASYYAGKDNPLLMRVRRDDLPSDTSHSQVTARFWTSSHVHPSKIESYDFETGQWGPLSSVDKFLVKFDEDAVPRDVRGRWTSTGESKKVDIRQSMARDTGADQSQPVKSLDELYDRSKAEEQAFKDVVEASARAAGGKVLYTPPEYAEPGTTLKKRDSAERKLRDELDGDVTQLRDILRATIGADTVEAARRAAADFIEKNGDSVLRVKDRFIEETAQAMGGYRDILVNYRTPGGLIAEVQFNGVNMLDAKNGEGHKIYNQLRDPAIMVADIAPLKQRMQAVYNTAYKADGNGHWGRLAA